jgi:hypothetical protein
MAYYFNLANSQYLSASIASYDEPLTIHARVNTDSSATVLGVVVLSTNGSALRHQLVITSSTRLANINSVTAGGAGSGANSATAVPLTTWNSIAGELASDTSRTAYRQGVAGGPNTTSRQITFDTLIIGAIQTATTVGFYFDGRLADIAVWTAVLTDREHNALRRGFKPHRIRPQSLLFYVPLLRNLQDAKGLLSLTNNNTATVADHPRVY